VEEAEGFTAGYLAPIAAKAPSWAEAMGRVNRYVMNDLGGGQRVLKLAWVINFQKLTTIPLLGFFIGWYHNTSSEAWIYFAMQSSYGLAWIVKDFAFPDSNFHKRITIGAGIASFLTVSTRKTSGEFDLGAALQCGIRIETAREPTTQSLLLSVPAMVR